MIIAGLIVLAGVVGFDLIMRLQTVITIVTGVLTVVYIVLVLGRDRPGRGLGPARRAACRR